MKQYRTLAAIGFILFLSWTLFICHAVSQVKFTQVERSSIKWTIPVAKRVVPGIPDFVMTYMTLANLIDSTEIELGTKIDSMKWSTGDTLKLYTSDGIFKTKITFTGMGTVTNVTGTSPIIITGTSTVTPNVTIQNATTSQSGALTSTDWNTFNNKVGGSGISTRMTYFNTANTVAPTSDFHYDSAYDRYGIGFNIGGWSGGVNNKLEITGGVAIGQTYPGQFTKPNGLIVKGEVGLNVEYSALGIGMFDYYTGFNRIDANNIEFYTNYEKMITYSANNFFVDYNRSSPRISQYATRGFEVRNVGSHYTRLTGDLYAGDSGYGGIMINGYINKSNDYVVADDNTVGTSGLFISRLGELSFRFWDAGGQTNSNPDRTPFSINSTGVVNITNLAGSGTRIVTTSSTGDLGAGVATSGIGTVTSVGITGSDFTITGSPVTTSGNIALEIATGVVGPTELASTAVSAGSYTNLNATIDADGRITSAANGTAGVTTLAAIGATANANGATISGSTLNLQPASASFGGVMTTGTQTIAGAKTFSYLGGAPSGGNSLIVADPNGRLENLYGATVGHVPKWNGTAFTLQADATGASGITSLGGLTGATQTLAYATSGTTPSWLSTGTSHTFRLPAGATGEVLKWSSGDWRPGFPISLTTTGTSGNATYNSTTGVLNIPNYTTGSTNDQYWLTDNNTTYHQIRMQSSDTPPANTDVSTFRLAEGNGVDIVSSGNVATVNIITTAVGQLHREASTTISFATTNPQKVAMTNAYTSGSGITVSDANDRITVATTGKYMITYSLDIDLNSTTAGITAAVRTSTGVTELSASFKQFENSTNVTPLSKTFYVDLSAGANIELWIECDEAIAGNTLWDPILTIQRVQ